MIFLYLLGCQADPPQDTDTDFELLSPPAEGEGFQLSMDYVVEPFSEVWACSVYTLPSDVVAPVNSVEYQQNPGMHHMTISTTGMIGGQVEPGTYDCKGLYEANMDDFIMIFGSQGEDHDTLQLPDGVAAVLPVGIDIIHEIHYVNATDQPVELYSLVNGYTIPSEDVVEGIWGGSVRDEHINIPASSEHTEWSRCEMNEDVEVLFLASHTHELGIEFSIRNWDGVEAGEVFFTNDDWHDPKITQYDPPLAIPAGSGFEFSCTWANPYEEMINYGTTSADEMCNLAIVHTPYSTSALCEVVDTSDGVLYVPNQ